MVRLIPLLAGAAAAYQVPAALPTCPRRAVSPVMVNAQEVFGQYFEASPPVQKSLQTLPPPVAKALSIAPIAVTGAAGFILTPSRRIPVSALGGALAGAVGNIGRKKLSDERQKAAMPAVAAKLSQGLQQVSAETLSAIATEYDVPKKEFDTQCGELYLAFLNACLTAHAVDPKELSELLRLQGVLSLSAAQAGTQIYQAARQLYSRHRAYLEDTEDNDSKKLLAKFVFLAERILAYDESPEGYRYESLRLQKLFSLTTPDWRQMAEDAAVPWYAKALDNAVIQNQGANGAQLASVRDSLGITEGCAEGMHADIFAKAATSMLESGTLSPSDKERLTSIESLLGMAPEATSKALSSLTAPIYTSSFEGVIAEVEAGSGSEAQQSGTLALRMQDLLLDPSEAHAIEAAALRKRAKVLLDEALQFLRVQNMAEGLSAVQKLSSFSSSLSSFMVSIGHAAGPAEAALPALFGGIKGGAKQSEILAMYRVLLLKYLESGVGEAENASLDQLRTLLGMSESDASSVYQAAAGPLYRKALQSAIDEGAGDAQKTALQARLTELGLPEGVTTAIGTEVYGEKLKAFASSAKIMSEDQSAELAKLRDFLGIAMDDVYPAHESACSESYLSSVREVMGTSGIIPDEYWDGLGRLRERLGISEETAQDLFGVEVTAKMKTFAEKAIEAMEEKGRKQQEAQQGGQGNMNIESALSTEVLNLVDFAMASKAIVKKEAAGKEFEVCGANLRESFEDVTLRQLYKQYLVEAFSGADASTNQRLFDNLNRLALILGLKSDEVSKIHNEIGSLIFRDYIGKALKKGPLGAEENMFLMSIKEALGMEQEKCDELVREQQMGRISMMVEGMFEKSQVIAEDVRKMRAEAESLEVDLVVDLQLSAFKLERMFLCELEDLVETGTLKPDNMGPLVDICEPLNISEEVAERMLTESVKKRCNAGLLQGMALRLQGNINGAAEELDKMLAFAALMPSMVADTKGVSAGEKNELYLLYQASQAGDKTPENVAKVELLKSVAAIA